MQTTNEQLPDYRASPDFLLDLLEFMNSAIICIIIFDLPEVVDDPPGVAVEDGHGDGGDDGEYVDEVPVKDKT